MKILIAAGILCMSVLTDVRAEAVLNQQESWVPAKVAAVLSQDVQKGKLEMNIFWIDGAILSALFALGLYIRKRYRG